MPIISYAQNYEDIMLWRALKHIDEGFYVDVGAAWPVEHSVTKLFYENKWRGINIEPNPLFYEKLQNERQDDLNLNIAVSIEKSSSEFILIENTGLSSLDKNVLDLHDDLDYLNSIIKVETDTLKNIFSNYANDRDIHFLKVDVEGYEKYVLEGNDWQEYRPWIVVVEATVPMSQTENYHEWEFILSEASYFFVYADGLNRFYISKEHSELEGSFKYPSNVFDEYIRYNEFEAIQRAINSESRASEAEKKTVEAEMKVSEAEMKVLEAEAKVLDQRAINSELRASEAEKKTVEAEMKVSEAEAKVSEAEMKVLEAEAKVLEAEAKVHAIVNSRIWKIVKFMRLIDKL